MGKIKHIAITGVPGSGIDHIIKFLKNVFSNIDIQESLLFNETVLSPSEDLDDDAINELIIQKLDSDTLYIILDNIPEVCRQYLVKKKIDINDQYYSVENLEEFREEFLTVYQYCRGNYIDNVMFITTMLPDSTETIMEAVKTFINKKDDE